MSRCEELLQILQSLAGCDYLSDLHQAYLSGRLQWVSTLQLKEIDLYSLEDWTRAIRYITGAEREFLSVSEAINFLARPSIRNGPD